MVEPARGVPVALAAAGRQTLQVTAAARRGAARPAPRPERRWGLHLLDANIDLGNLHLPWDANVELGDLFTYVARRGGGAAVLHGDRST